MATKLTLENAGDRAVMTVSECKSVTTKFGTKLVFTGTTDEGELVETPLIPDTTGLKQLDRLGLTADTAVGERLEFSRAANPSGKPYWNIDPARSGGAAPSKRMAPPSATAAPAATPAADRTLAQRREAIVSQYLLLFQTLAHQMSNIVGPVDAQAVQAATATVWISWKDKGIQPDGLLETKAAPAPAVPTTPAPSGKRIAPPTQDFSKFPPETDEDDSLPF